MELNWDDIKTVLTVTRSASLADAGAALDLNYTTVARRIARAESALGQPLFERLADGYRPTEAGRLVARHGADMETANHRMLREVQGRDTTLRGALVLTAPQLLIAHAIAPVLQAFITEHPEIDLHIRASNDILDLSRREADLAIRISRAPGDSLMGLRLTPQHAAVYGSADWAARLADDPMTPVDWLLYDQMPGLPKGLDPAYPNHRIRMRFDDMVAMVGAAAAGLGVVRMPMFLGRAQPQLVQLPVLVPQPYPDIWVVGHRDVWPGAKLVALRAALVGFFKTRAADFVAS